MSASLVRPLRASGLLLAVLACATATQASSFDCAKAASASEKAICADPYTAGLDSQLGKAWTATLAEAKDPKALRLGQREWLKQRDQCQADLGCLRSQYLSRLMVLRYVNIAFNWQGTWQRVSVSPFYGGELVIRRSGEDRLSFDLSAMGGANSGALAGKLQLKDGEARYSVEGCQLRLTPRNGLLQVTQEGDSYACGAGSGVYYDGLYVASRQILEHQYDLLSTALVRTEEEDLRARKLLQKDYQTLLDSGSVFSQDTSAELKGAEVTDMWLQGLANTNAAIFVRGAKGELWVALLAVVGPTDEVRVRYYTTEPEWKQRLPDVVQRWYEARSQGQQLPLDMMP
ncbi:lysozyme inhibitor LprI family protein [Pseudomonas sp. TNT2022 ID1048]|uniref:lysozyme inhibitor LprI family protein n=1 Tax=Pseudomonas TaxID=286 RepID=UPI0022343EA1|nr:MULTISPECIES: lysozyme inhibitor LprI family protein [Pseudomonas]MDD1017399.1 lysozyme inhibitor LprI family protein [Pseudomonas idahonensis]UZE37519.1 lysozyme inhibitor LprI family protein [Pseudomonas sp. B21-059]